MELYVFKVHKITESIIIIQYIIGLSTSLRIRRVLAAMLISNMEVFEKYNFKKKCVF